MIVRAMVAMAALSTGCSWIFMTKAPGQVATPNLPVDCTSSRAAPVLDTICSGYFVANGIYLLAVKDCADASFGETCVSSGTKTGGALLSAGLAVVCIASAASGYGYASRCEQVKDWNSLCISGDLSACQQLRPNWVPQANWQPGPAAPEIQRPEPSGCSKDTDCKGNRICERGLCVEPRQ